MQCEDFSFIATREVTPKQTAQVIIDDLIKKQLYPRRSIRRNFKINK